MGLEAVIEEIREKGKKEAEKIRVESKNDADRIIAAANKNVEAIKLAAEAESAKHCSHIIEQEVSAANLLVKRELLNAQKALLDTVYDDTLMQISNLPESFHREAIIKLLTLAKKEIPSGKLYCNERDVAAVSAIISENPEFNRFKLGDPIKIDGGILIEGEGGELQIDYSYRTFLAKVWESGLKDASDILFG